MLIESSSNGMFRTKMHILMRNWPNASISLPQFRFDSIVEIQMCIRNGFYIIELLHLQWNYFIISIIIISFNRSELIHKSNSSLFCLFIIFNTIRNVMLMIIIIVLYLIKAMNIESTSVMF